MRSPLDFFRKTELVAEPLKPQHGAAMARLHGEAFSRPWNDGEFRALLGQPPVFGFIARPKGAPGQENGFILARLAAGEAEILTVAVARSVRRAGAGRMLVAAVLQRLHQLRAETVFLEVDETNNPAIGLYKRFGFAEVARRPAYYDTAAGKSAALVMRLDLK